MSFSFGLACRHRFRFLHPPFYMCVILYVNCTRPFFSSRVLVDNRSGILMDRVTYIYFSVIVVVDDG